MRSGKTVSVIGSGIAGLSAAVFLAANHHPSPEEGLTVFLTGKEISSLTMVSIY